MCVSRSAAALAWFGGDPHLTTLDNLPYSCNVLGSFIYAQTTRAANGTARLNTETNSDNLNELVSDELFSIIARTSETQTRLPVPRFFNAKMTYFSSFSMYLGLSNDVMIDVDIDPAKTYQFSRSRVEENQRSSIVAPFF